MKKRRKNAGMLPPNPYPLGCAVPDHPHPPRRECGGGQETGVGVGWEKK